MLYLIYRSILLTLMKSTILVGGQAVIEGVMMRVPGAYATAVRDQNGKIHINRHPFNSITEKYKILRLPFIRGVIGLFESLKIGYSTLQWSADIIENQNQQKSSNTFFDILLTVISMLIAISLFSIAHLIHNNE